jgi:hypothetical protein
MDTGRHIDTETQRASFCFKKLREVHTHILRCSHKPPFTFKIKRSSLIVDPREIETGCEVDSSGSGYRIGAGSCISGNAPSGFIKCWEKSAGFSRRTRL